MNKIQRVSQFFRVLFQIGFVLSPLMLILGWTLGPVVDAPTFHWGGNSMAFGMSAFPKDIHVMIPITFTIRCLGFLVSLLPTLVDMTLLAYLIKLFRCYERREIFTPVVVHTIQKISLILLVRFFVNILYILLINLVLSGFHLLKLNISAINLSTLLLILFVSLIAWIMSEGCQLQEEQQLTV